jgi:WD40 repeat protein
MRIFFFIAALFFAELCFAQAPELVIPKGHAGVVSVLAISPDKKWLASGDDKGTVKLWDMQTAKEVRTFDNNPELSILYSTKALAFSPDSKKLYIGLQSTLRIHDLSNAGKEIFNKKIHENTITQILFSANGKIFATAADDEVKIWDAANLASPKVVAIKGKKPKLAFDDANNIIVVTTGNYTQVSSSFDFTEIVTNTGYITHINTATGQVIVTDEFENLPSDETYISPNGKLLAITRYEKLIEDNEQVSVGTVHLLDVATKKIIKKFTGIQDSSINMLSFSSNNRYMATKAGKSFILYDLVTLKFVKTFYSEDIFTESILFSADDTKLLQGIRSNGSVVQWNLKESKVEQVFGSQANFVKDLAVAPDQKSLVLLYGTSEYYGERVFLQKFDLNSTVLSKIKSTGITGSMKNFDIASAGGGRLFEPNTVNKVDAILSNQTVTAFSISNNNKILVTTNQYESQPQLSFYNVEDGKKISDIPLQTSAYSFLFSKDDKILYVGYQGNNKIDKIEIKTGAVLKTFEHIDSYSKDRKIEYMLLSKDESTLIGVNEFRKMYSWNTATGIETELRVSRETGGFSLKTVPNTNTFIYGDGIKNIEIYDLSANKIISALTCNSRTIGALDITPDGKFIFYCNNDICQHLGFNKGSIGSHHGIFWRNRLGNC